MNPVKTTGKTVLAVFLSVCCLIALLGGCGRAKNPPERSAAETTTASPAETTETNYTSDLPKNLEFNEEFSLVARNHAGVADEFYSVGITESLIESAVYRRCSAVETRLGVSLNVTLVEDEKTYSHSTIVRKLENEMAVGESSYDLVAVPMYTTISSQVKGTFLNLYDLNYLDLTKYYWAQNANSALSIGKAQFIATGAATLSIYRFMYITVINSDFLTVSRFPENYIYHAVKDGNWTLDLQAEIAKDLYMDRNGNSERDEGDAYGFVSGARTSVDTYWISTDSTVVTKDPENYYVFSASTDRISGVVDKILRLYYDYEGSYIVPYANDNTDNAQILNVFNRGNTAMATMMVNAIESGVVGNAYFLYEIAPIPKYEAAQDGYFTHVQDQVTAMAVPSNVAPARRDMVGAVMESLAEEGYRYLYAAYFEKILPYRYLQSQESVEMLQLIYESVGFGIVEQEMAGGQITTMLREIISAEVNMVSSKMESVTRNAPDMIREVNDAYRELYLQTNPAGE